VARVSATQSGRGRHAWEYDQRSVEAYRDRMHREPAPEVSPEWMPIAEAMAVLKMTRHGVKRRMKMGLLDFTHFGPAEKSALYVSRAQVEEQAQERPNTGRRTQWSNIPADEAFLIWFAGFFDGEGCIIIRRTERRSRFYWQLDLTLNNSATAAILEIEQKIGGKSYFRKRQKSHYRDQRVWAAHGDEALQVLKAIRPHLRAKHLQADLGIEFQEHIRARPGSRWEMVSPEESQWRNEQQRKISLLNRPNVER